ncbi:MAG: methylated-DNA--[protein]-cysteine S-methyltransferase [Bacteroidaceae bacterium]|nr:methylated-DNA--[protein]-cysteine S-methyltransferase [Bacteroidaceae bacterium]
MICYRYTSPLGGMVIESNDRALTGIWFDGQKYFGGKTLPDGKPYPLCPMPSPVIRQAIDWLDCYFSGNSPSFTPPLHLSGTPFQQLVWGILLDIPYGETQTYGGIAAQIARRNGGRRVSAQAVGGAVGHNPISLIVPCHRVIGADGKLTGYAGGIEKKAALLRMESCMTAGKQKQWR